MPGVDPDEDISCPDFFELGGKRVLVCISHQKGARYYIGTWNGSKFTPESHCRMNWAGGSCFAPETATDGSGRRIMWAMLRGYETGRPGGVMSMPRELTLSEDGRSLQFTPARELEVLRFRPHCLDSFKVSPGRPVVL